MILLNAVDTGLFTPSWSPQVMQELGRVVLPVQPAVSTATIRRRIEQMSRAFEDTNMLQTVALSTSFDLPDEGGRHASIAAIADRADVLVTDSLWDSPDGMLRPYVAEKCSPDDLLSDLLDLNLVAIVRILDDIAEAPRQPSRDVSAVLASLIQCNAGNSIHAVQAQL